MAGYFKTTNSQLPQRAKQGGGNGINVINGVYLGVVTNTTDSIYSGTIRVHIPEFGAEKGASDRTILLCTPYGGTTQALEASGNVTAFGDQTDADGNATASGGTPKSYGMWPQPPAIGTEVLVAFTSSREEGFLIGATIGKDRNHMMGGRASAESYSGVLTPVGEKNPYDTNDPDTKPTDNVAFDALKEQGLHEDYVRGHSMSSARRESPSNVFGITTLNGHVFTMDDGDQQGQSRNMRLKTRGGAQVLLDDTNKMIFINNHNGSAWVEIDEQGRIDVYAKGSISMHSEDDFNLHAKGNINMQADQGVNIRSAGSEGIKVEASVGSFDMYAAQNFQLQAAINGNVTAGASYKETAARIDMNGPVATASTRITMNPLVDNKNVLASAAARVPEHHPWLGATKIQETFDTAKGNTA
jgi:hypothetical protein